MLQLTINEAATALGVSVDTIKRRLKRGELAACKDERGRWVISLPAPADAPAGATVRTGSAPAPGTAPAMQGQEDNSRQDVPVQLLVQTMQTQIKTLEATIEDQRKRLDQAEVAQAELRRIVAALTQRVP